jgi:hypothetical protein
MHYAGSACAVPFIVIKFSWMSISGKFLTNNSNVLFCGHAHRVKCLRSFVVRTAYRLTELHHTEHTVNFFPRFSSSRLKPNSMLCYFLTFLRPQPPHTHSSGRRDVTNTPTTVCCFMCLQCIFLLCKLITTLHCPHVACVRPF